MNQPNVNRSAVIFRLIRSAMWSPEERYQLLLSTGWGLARLLRFDLFRLEDILKRISQPLMT